MIVSAKGKKLALLALLLAASSCGKKKDDAETTAEPTPTPETQPVAGTLALMPSIAMDCGGKSCFYKESSSLNLEAESSGGNGSSFIQAMQQMLFVSMGFPTDALYDQLTTDQKALIPKGGLVDRIESVRAALTTAAADHYTGEDALASCSAAPATGTFPYKSGVDATWLTPVLKAPAGNKISGGEKYEKALSVTVDGFDYHFEFNCDKTSMAIASKKTDNSIYYVFFYEVDSDKITRAEFDLNAAGGVVSGKEMNLAVEVVKNKDNDVQIWMSRTGPRDDNYYMGFRYATNKAGASDKISFYQVSEGDGDAILNATWPTLSGVTSDRVEPASSNNAQEEAHGCASGWNASSDTFDMSALCSGLSLSKAPKTGLDPDGDNSLLWVDQHLKTLVKAIF